MIDKGRPILNLAQLRLQRFVGQDQGAKLLKIVHQASLAVQPF